ncbi:MAG: YHS domain-containing protein [Chloroflexi bacterium]|nr:YHS domain-containing protein [Chloroflexota bacterium]
MIKDPVCGMTLSESNAKAKLVYRGQTYYFCSMLCKHLFEREPQKYVLPARDEQHPPSAS